MTESPSYIDYDLFLSPDFSAIEFANSLILSTNNATDTPLDLSTPLSKVLFDIQEVDTHIHDAASKAAVPLLSYTHAQSEAGRRIADGVQGQVQTLADDYARLEREVVRRWQEADEVRRVVERLWETVRLGRAVARCLALGRQLEVQMAELLGSVSGSRGGTAPSTGSGSGTAAAAPPPGSKQRREDHRALVRIANTLLSLRQVFLSTPEAGGGGGGGGGGDEGYEGERLGEELNRVKVVKTLQDDLIVPAQKHVIARAAQIVREFSMTSTIASSGAGAGAGAAARDRDGGRSNVTTSAATGTMAATYIQTEETKSRTISALIALYLLSPVPASVPNKATSNDVEAASFQPDLLINALQSYLQTALTSSVASLMRALGSLSTLDRTLAEISARCQNIVALEALLRGVNMPAHPLLPQTSAPATSGPFLLGLGREGSSGDGSDPLHGKVTQLDLEAAPHDDSHLPEDPNGDAEMNLLTPLLISLDASSLPSHFWRSLASAVGSRLEDITPSSITTTATTSSSSSATTTTTATNVAGPGNISIRNLGANQQRIRDAIRQCVLRGFQNPGLAGGGVAGKGNVGSSGAGREREVAVMVGAVLGVLSR